MGITKKREERWLEDLTYVRTDADVIFFLVKINLTMKINGPTNLNKN